MREVFGLFCMLVLLRGLVSTHLTDASISHSLQSSESISSQYAVWTSRPLAYYIQMRMLALCDEIDRLQKEVGRLRTVFRVNMLRHAPPENVDAEINRVLYDEKR